MKKLAIIIIVLCFAVQSFAAGSCTVTAGDRTDLTAEVIWSCIGDASDGSIPNTSAGVYSSLFRKFPYTLSLVVENLSTQTDVTTDADVYLYDKESGGADLIEGYGVDTLDSDTRNFVRLVTNPVGDQVWIGVTNQSATSGAYTVILTVTK